MEINNSQPQMEKPATIADMCYVYAKMKWMRTFKAFDLNGYFVKKLIFASMLADSSDVRTKLQQLADDNPFHVPPSLPPSKDCWHSPFACSQDG